MFVVPLVFREVDRVIVGVDNIVQLKEIIEKSKLHKSNIDWSFMTSNDQMLINPSSGINYETIGNSAGM